MVTHHVSGLPAVTSDGDLVGIVNRAVIVRALVRPDEEIAAMMLDQMVRRVPVTSGGKVVGIVSASDIVQLFLNLHERPRWTASEKGRETTRGRSRRR